MVYKEISVWTEPNPSCIHSTKLPSGLQDIHLLLSLRGLINCCWWPPNKCHSRGNEALKLIGLRHASNQGEEKSGLLLRKMHYSSRAGRLDQLFYFLALLDCRYLLGKIKNILFSSKGKYLHIRKMDIFLLFVVNVANRRLTFKLNEECLMTRLGRLELRYGLAY